MIVLHAATLLLGAVLLFTIQPLFARLALPLLGGSPAVWNTAMVFFQSALLAGYAYAHWLTSRDPRRRPWLHVGLLALAGATLPIRIPPGWSPPTAADPTAWLIGLFAVGVGAPFLLVSTTGPLIQRWFSASGHPRAGDPYFLYVASNVGSLAGLLAYPFLIEPRWTLAAQTRAWTAGYVVLVALAAACAFVATRPGRPRGAECDGAAGPAVPWTRRLRWVFLALVPSSLMLGATSHLSTDIAAIPLLWVVPLALYLLSFIVAFAPRAERAVAVAARALPFAMVGMILVIQMHANRPLGMIVSLHLATLLLAAVTAHGALASSRPPAARLTEFYLWIAVGGALGGVFNALVAPLVFPTIVEYRIALVLACLCLPAAAGGLRPRILDGAVPAVVGLGFAALAALAAGVDEDARTLAAVGALVAAAFAVFAVRRRPVRFALAVAAVFVARPWGMAEPGRQVHVERSFFGVHRVLRTQDEKTTFHVLMHGTTVHGLQQTSPLLCGQPLSYYHRLGPASQVMALGPDGGRRIGVAGLGNGGLASYARPGDRWTFYEIDPIVRRIAADSTLFCFLSSMAAPYEVRLGDARLSLAADSAARFDLLVLDAYSSDAIPVHLLTREALRLYVARLAPGGVLALHISNRNFALAPVVETLALDAGLACRIRAHRSPSAAEIEAGLFPSEWAVLARADLDLGPLRADPHWRRPSPAGRALVWTDDYSSLVSVLR
jgi:spermidine synthase